MTNLPIDEFLAVAAQDTYPQKDEILPEMVVHNDPVVIDHGNQTAMPMHPFVILGPVLVIILFLIGIILNRSIFDVAQESRVETAVPQSTVVANVEAVVRETAVPLPKFPSSQNKIIAPYNEYVLTQGPHGSTYGHMAIDIAAGNGATILSPIDGLVTELYVDEYANTVLVIENDKYQILMMHGNYSVNKGDEIKLGQSVGTESNNGFTKDMYGNLCYQRDCGYHTHLNIYDKIQGTNVNPLELLGIN
ncbi:MAG: M23 family peptidase [Chloroflexi bacterium]|nr:MAG: M23 family peptidase [Chloroflexota bacterium]